jgi:outer membrane protein assembly factor BamB
MKFVVLRSLLTLAALSSAVFPMVCQTSVLTRSYDNGRTGWNSTEWTLTPQAVQSRGLQSISLVPGDDDPRIEAQPLYIPGITMPDGKKHDVIYICTMSNNIWAFDANTGAKLWAQPTSLGQPFLPGWNDAVDSMHINRSFGILSTPVIDPETSVMYVVDWDTNDPAHQNRAMHVNAIRLTDGKRVPNKPALLIQASVINASHQTISFNQVQKQRAAMLLVPLHGKATPTTHKILYVATTGTEEPPPDADPTNTLHGWLIAFDVDAWQQVGQWTPTPNTFGGGMWQGAQGPAADAEGNVYVITGNGGYKTVNGTNIDVGLGITDFPEAFARLTHTNTAQGPALTLTDWFMPFRDSIRHAYTQAEVAPYPAVFNYQDQDLGSAGPLLIPGTAMLAGAGKDGILYVMDRNNMGKVLVSTPQDFAKLKAPPIFFTYDPDASVPAYQNATPTGNQDYKPMPGVKTHHLHGTPVYYASPQGHMLYGWGENGSLRAFLMDATGHATLAAHGADIASADLASSTSNTLGGMPGGMLSGSSAGKENGIIWTTAPVTGDGNKEVVPGAFRAYGAYPFAPNNPDGVPQLKKIFEATGFQYSKFCPPVVADGRVIVATYQGRVDVYTLKPPAAAVTSARGHAAKTAQATAVH